MDDAFDYVVYLQGASLDHLIRPLQGRWRDRQGERLGGLEVAPTSTHSPARGIPERRIPSNVAHTRSVYRTPTRPHWHRPGKDGRRCWISVRTTEIIVSVALMWASAMHWAQCAVPVRSP